MSEGISVAVLVINNDGNIHTEVVRLEHIEGLYRAAAEYLIEDGAAQASEFLWLEPEEMWVLANEIAQEHEVISLLISEHYV